MKPRILKIKRIAGRIVPHLFFWVTILTAYTFLYGHRNGAYVSVLLILIYTLPVYLGATYFTLYFLIPRFLLTRKYQTFAIYFIYTSLATIFLEIAILIYGVMFPVVPAGSWLQPVDPASVDIFFLLAGIYGVVLLASAIKLVKYAYEGQRRTKQLSREKLEAELKFLKAQIHPHFLFNTLNNLYALTLKKSDQAPEMIMKLSELLDYMIYQSNADRVSLEQEVHLLRNYLALEQIRYGERLQVSLDIEGNVAGKQIAPLLILPFVENSFKHGISKQGSNAWIRIRLEVSSPGMNITIENSQPDSPAANPAGNHHGIGLQNAQKRLELMYPGRYNLSVENRVASYRVRLELRWETRKGVSV